MCQRFGAPETRTEFVDFPRNTAAKFRFRGRNTSKNKLAFVSAVSSIDYEAWYARARRFLRRRDLQIFWKRYEEHSVRRAKPNGVAESSVPTPPRQFFPTSPPNVPDDSVSGGSCCRPRWACTRECASTPRAASTPGTCWTVSQKSVSESARVIQLHDIGESADVVWESPGRSMKSPGHFPVERGGKSVCSCSGIDFWTSQSQAVLMTSADNVSDNLGTYE